MVVFYIVLAILLFSVLIFVHELGHFLTAKLFGVQVNEFSLFMGPAIWKKQKGETLYALRCIPIGGYCAMEGEDGESDNPRAFGNAKVYQRLIILLAGSLTNFLAGFVMMLLLVCFTSPFTMLPGREISYIEESRPFAQTLQVGDTFYAIDGERVYIHSDITMLLDRDTDGFHDVTVIRDGEKVKLEQVEIRRDFIDENGIARYGFSIPYEEKTFLGTLSYSWNNTVDFVRLVRLGLQDLFTGRAGIEDAGGPVMIIETVVEQGVQAEEVSLGIANVFYLFAFIAVNLAVMNLLPIPALDGGRAVALLITAALEKLLRRKLNPKYEAYIHGAFMILLLVFIALITFKDIWHLFGG